MDELEIDILKSYGSIEAYSDEIFENYEKEKRKHDEIFELFRKINSRNPIINGKVRGFRAQTGVIDDLMEKELRKEVRNVLDRATLEDGIYIFSRGSGKWFSQMMAFEAAIRRKSPTLLEFLQDSWEKAVKWDRYLEEKSRLERYRLLIFEKMRLEMEEKYGS